MNAADKEPVSITVRRIEIDDVWFDGIGPLEVKAIARDVEMRIEKLSREKNTFDTFKLLLHAAMYYAAQAYGKTNSAGNKTKEDNKQLDTAIDKLTHALNSLPLK
jgi:hypothetical protein